MTLSGQNIFLIPAPYDAGPPIRAGGYIKAIAGNALGPGALDLQTYRSSVAEVASGNYAIGLGYRWAAAFLVSRGAT